MTRDLIVHKLDARGEELWRYPGRLMERSHHYARVEATFDLEEVEIGALTLRRGDRFIETYYFDRWYNVFAIFEAGSGNFKGWYCNIARPARLREGDIYAEDLAIDVIVTPRWEIQIVDREEFEALDLSDEDRGQALAALGDLLAQIRGRSGHFAQRHTINH